MSKNKAATRSSRVNVFKERCRGCNLCVEFCPKHVLRQSSEINSKGYHIVLMDDGSKCSGCNLCNMICPDFAISVISSGNDGESTEEV